MIIANLPYLINAIILMGYLVFFRPICAWPTDFVWWLWLPAVLHLDFHRYAFGLQNTTYNIGRIYLLRQHGIGYSRQDLFQIQKALVPDSHIPFAVLWMTVHMVSFAVLLFFQGWVAAVFAEIAVITIGGLLPIHHSRNLKTILGQVRKMDASEFLPLYMSGITIDGLDQLIEQAITENRHPRKWHQETVAAVTSQWKTTEWANRASETSDPAPGAGSSSPQG